MCGMRLALLGREFAVEPAATNVSDSLRADRDRPRTSERRSALGMGMLDDDGEGAPLLPLKSRAGRLCTEARRAPIAVDRLDESGDSLGDGDIEEQVEE